MTAASVTTAVLAGSAAAPQGPSPKGPAAQKPAALVSSAGSSQWLIELDAPSAVQVWAGEKDGAETAAVAARRQAAVNDANQRAVLESLHRAMPDIQVVFRLQKVLNGIAVRLADESAVAELRRVVEDLPGVARLRPMEPKHRTNATSVPFLGTAAIWDAGSGLDLTGDGLTIGIIDTGVDYLHTSFGGSGLAADYAANDPTVLDGFFPTTKVAGGFDFAGDAYDASSDDPGQNVPQPDADPMDCEGHGTHVAGTAAGFGVLMDGQTFPGPYGAAVPFDDLRIGPGVAPRATLYALRVFGCSGTSNVVEAALEWAVDPDGDGDFSDHLDIVNLSLASRFGAADDPTADAANQAALAGVVVVASAGNDGDVTSILGTPASADRAIAVAASWDDETSFPTRAVRIDGSGLAGTHQAGGANFGPPVVAPGLTGAAALADPLDACSPLSAPLAGAIAVIRRDAGCTFVTQTRNAQDAGALAVVLVNDRPELQGVLNDGTGGDITIPPVLIRQITGEPLIEALEKGGSATLTVTSASLADQAALFSSRGPRRGDGVLKPDVSAPGVIITSAALGNAGAGGTGSAIRSGTSMAAPHVAGLAAVVLERRPDFTPAEVKAALVNTARNVFLDPEDTPPRMSTVRMGAGRVQAVPAASTDVIAYQLEHPEQVGLSFGHFEVITTASDERIVRLENRGGGAATFDVSLDGVGALSGVSVSLPGGTVVSVGAGQAADVPLRVEIDGSALRHQREPAQEAALFGLPRQWLSEWSAHLIFTPTSGASTALRVPLHLTARAAAEMASAGPLELGPGNTGVASLELEGTEVDTGSQPPEEERSLVSVLELVATPDSDPAQDPGFDIIHVGVATDAAAVGLPSAVFYVGLATRGTLLTPLEARFEVAIDVDRDGSDDFLLFSSDEGSFAFGSFATDGFITVLRDLTTNAETRQLPLEVLGPASWHSVPFYTDVRLLAVRAADLGLVPDAAEIDVTVRVLEGLGGAVIAGGIEPPRGRLVGEAGPFTFDLERPGLDASGGVPAPPAPIHFDVDGGAIDVAYDVGALAARETPGLLLLHHHNSGVRRAEVVPLLGDFPDLVVELAATPQPVAPDGVMTARALVRNEGPQPATGVQLRWPSQAESVFEAATSDPSCAPVPAAVVCGVGDLDGGAEHLLEVTFRLTGAAPGSVIQLEAEASTGSFEGNVLNNVATTEVLVSGVLLNLTKSVFGDLAQGAAVTYQLELTNSGPLDQSDLAGPELIDVLPPELRLLGATASAGAASAEAATGTVAWSGPLAAGETVTLEILAAVEAAAGVPVSNQAVAFFDAGGDGVADGEVVSDDPATPVSGDPTLFLVAPAAIDIPATGRLGLAVLAILLTIAGWRIRR